MRYIPNIFLDSSSPGIISIADASRRVAAVRVASRRVASRRVASRCVSSRRTLFAIHDTRFPELNALGALQPIAFTCASYRADGRPYTGPGILTCAHLASVDPASGRWEDDLFLPGSSRAIARLFSLFPIVSPLFVSLVMLWHLLTPAGLLTGTVRSFYN